MTNPQLVRRMKKRGILLSFVGGRNAGVYIEMNANKDANEKYLAANIEQVKTITQTQWHEQPDGEVIEDMKQRVEEMKNN